MSSGPGVRASPAPATEPAPRGPWQAVAALLGLLLFAGVIGAEFAVLWAWQARTVQEQGRSGLAPPSPRPEPEAPGAAAARLAIVIDDWGYAWAAAREILEMDGPFTVAVIPFLPHSVEQARRARARGHEVLVHLPMEPEDPRLDPGRGAVTTALPDEEIRRRVEAAIRAVPGAVGVSNHMGSRATADARVMGQVLAVVARHRLFFLDSATSPRSVVGPVADALGVPWLRNRVFVDGQRTVESIKARLLQAAALARRDGYAVAIGHVRPQVAAALREVLPELRRQGVELVPASLLVGRRASQVTGEPGKMKVGDVRVGGGR